MSRVIASIDGIEVIATEPASGPHPHPRYGGQIVAFNGITRVLLADNTERFICDTCDKPWDNIKSAASHRTAHSPTKNEPDMSQDLIKAVVRAVKRIREDDKQRFQKAADALNWAGVKTTRGLPWTQSNVRTVYKRYAGTVRVRVSRPKEVEGENVTPVVIEVGAQDVVPVQIQRDIINSLDAIATSTGESISPDDVKVIFKRLRYHMTTVENRLAEFNDQVARITAVLDELEPFVEQFAERGELDGNIVEKARKYDILREHLS